jgi:UDP-glucose 4-epimerase
MNVLITGGLGYIGSHISVVLLDAGYNVFLFDNLVNSSRDVVEKISSITNKKLLFLEGDVRDSMSLIKFMRAHNIDAVIHLAGLKAVGESVSNPLEYFDNNVCGLVSLVSAMQKCNIKKLIFSSSATVYGDPAYLPLDEEHPKSATNPYGRTKLHCEEILADIAKSDSTWRITSLRYFNPIGAHSSGLIGENPSDTPNNIMPYIVQVAKRALPELIIFGNNYATADGTGVRDYIHVEDLSEGHFVALNQLSKRDQAYDVFNLGAGRGFSVLELISAFEHVSGCKVHFKIGDIRPGDVGTCFASIHKAKVKLKWQARELFMICVGLHGILKLAKNK